MGFLLIFMLGFIGCLYGTASYFRSAHLSAAHSFKNDIRMILISLGAAIFWPVSPLVIACYAVGHYSRNAWAHRRQASLEYEKRIHAKIMELRAQREATRKITF